MEALSQTMAAIRDLESRLEQAQIANKLLLAENLGLERERDDALMKAAVYLAFNEQAANERAHNIEQRCELQGHFFTDEPECDYCGFYGPDSGYISPANVQELNACIEELEWAYDQPNPNDHGARMIIRARIAELKAKKAGG